MSRFLHTIPEETRQYETFLGWDKHVKDLLFKIKAVKGESKSYTQTTKGIRLIRIRTRLART